MRRVCLFLTAVLLWLMPAAAVAPAAHAAGTWMWPVMGPVLEPFDPPASPFGSGHRGIDIGGAVGTTVVAASDGVVTFAGPVGGRLFLTIDHGGGLESRYSFLDALVVRRNDPVTAGMPIASTGPGHAGSLVPHLHFAVLIADEYQDPLDHLMPISVTSFIRLAPLPS